MRPVRTAVLELADLETLLEIGESVADGCVGCSGEKKDANGYQGEDKCP